MSSISVFVPIKNESIRFQPATTIRSANEVIRSTYSIQGGSIFDSNSISIGLDSLLQDIDGPLTFDKGVLLVNDNSAEDDFITDLLKNTMMDVSSTAPKRKKSHKMKLLKYYGEEDKDGNNKHRCMVLDQLFPVELICGAHLFRCKLSEIGSKYFHVTEVDNERNGLLLFKPIEIAFAKYQVTIIKENDNFVLRVIDPGIKQLPLINLLDDNQLENWIGLKKTESDASNIEVINRLYKEKYGSVLKKRKRKGQNKISKTFDFRTTFGDLDGRKLMFKNLKRPFHRVLNLHARMAVHFAEKDKIIRKGDIEFQDFWSEVDLSSKLRRFGYI